MLPWLRREHNRVSQAPTAQAVAVAGDKRQSHRTFIRSTLIAGRPQRAPLWHGLRGRLEPDHHRDPQTEGMRKAPVGSAKRRGPPPLTDLNCSSVLLPLNSCGGVV